MKNRNVWITFLVMLITLISYAHAQSVLDNPSQPKHQPFHALKTYKSPARLIVEERIAITKPGYYTAIFDSGVWKPAQNPHTTLRAQATCADNFLCSNAALPVTLISFKGARVDATQVKIFWETSSETNNEGFDVERSATGTGNFIKVGFIDGSGNTVHTKKYEITDLNSSLEMSYYRLKQIDFDGNFTYSRIVAVAGFKEQLAVTATPNPSQSKDIYLQITGLQKITELELIIVDAKGVVVYRNNNVTLNPANQIVPNKITALTEGVYHARITSIEGSSATTFVITN